MTATKDGLGIEEVPANDAPQTQIMGDVPEGVEVGTKIPKSPQTLRRKKDKQVMGLVHMSPRNPRYNKLSMEEKGKEISIETDEEEEDLQALITAVEEEEEVEEDIQPSPSLTKLLVYVPPRKGKTKVPKNLDEMKSSLQTLLLPNGIVFEGMHLGCVPTMKFEDWDLAQSEKFQHLETGI